MRVRVIGKEGKEAWEGADFVGHSRALREIYFQRNWEQ